MKRAVILVVFVFLICVMAAQAGDLDEVKKSGVLRLGISPNSAPFAFYDGNDELTGIDVELIKEVAKRMNLETEVTEMSSDDLVESLDIGQVDIVGGAFSKTASRSEAVDFTRAYYVAEAVFLARRSLLLTEPIDEKAFENKKVGVLKNSGFEEWLKSEMVGNGTLQKKDIYTYDTVDNAVRALDRGKLDLLMLDVSLYQAKYQRNSNYRNYQFGSAEDQYAFALKKGSDLRTEINRQLAAVLKDGTAQKIADRFFSEDYSDDQTMIQWNSKTASTPTPTPAPTSIVIPTAAAAETNCSYAMAYVADVTIPDGQTISGGSYFTKTWRIRNTGSCTWTQAFTMSFVSGTSMGGSAQYLPAAVYPGDMVDVSVNLVAPDAPGTYQGNWQLKSPQGVGIGPNIWVQIVVPGGYVNPAPTTGSVSYATPVPTATPHIHIIEIAPTNTPDLHIIATLAGPHFELAPTNTPNLHIIATLAGPHFELAPTNTPNLHIIATLAGPHFELAPTKTPDMHIIATIAGHHF